MSMQMLNELITVPSECEQLSIQDGQKVWTNRVSTAACKATDYPACVRTLSCRHLRPLGNNYRRYHPMSQQGGIISLFLLHPERVVH